jgi:hypothetical protein
MAQSRPVDVSKEFQNMRQDDPRIQHNKDIEEMTRAIYAQMVATRGQPMDRRQQQTWMTIAREKSVQKLSKYAPGRPAPQQSSSGFPSQPSEYRRSRNFNNFESTQKKQDLAERKQSPLEDFEGLQFRMVNDNGQLFVNAFDSSGGNELGHVTFDIGHGKELDPQNLYVKHKFRSQGIARTMYDFVKSKGYKIQRSWDQTDAGAGFWDKHRGEERVWENFADGRNPQDKGDAKRHGINTRASVSSLRKTAKQGGRKGQLAHWLANMKSGRAKKK